MIRNILLIAIGTNVSLLAMGIAMQDSNMCLLAIASAGLCILSLSNKDE